MTSRREFLKVAGSAGAGLVLGLRLDAKPRPGDAAEPRPFRPNAYLAIRPDGTAVLTVPKSEMGQGVRTTLPLVLAEELDLDWSRVELVQAMPGPEFPHLGTGGSTSVSTTWTPLRRAGAAAREMLVAAAAQAWGVPASQCRTEKGTVRGPGGQHTAYGDLVEAAARLPVPKAPKLKPASQFRLLGHPTPRVDGPKLVTGKATFGLDTRRPGQRFAAVLRCPVPGGMPKDWDVTKALSVRGVRAVVQVPTGLAVVADGTWPAFKGREALAATVTWEEGPNRAFSSKAHEAQLKAALDGPADPARRKGDAAPLLAAAARVLEAEYAFPFQAHATMEPMNATARVRPGDAELWTGTQSPNTAQERAAAVLGLKPQQVKVNVALLGGGFGRRSGTDFTTEAAQVAQAAGGGPIQVVWDRTDDLRHDQYHPATLHRLKVGLDGQGRVAAWSHRIAGGAVLRSWLGGQKAPGQAETEANGAWDIPYDIPALDISFAEVEVPFSLGWWRAIEIVPNVFARECFLDEVAHASGKDPLAFRLELLGTRGRVKMGDEDLDIGRLRQVLQLAAEKAGWGRKMPPGHGLGLACHAYDRRTYLAAVAEVSVSRGQLRVHKVVTAVDCGLVLNPLGLTGQVEGGVAWGVSALFSQVTFEQGRVVQENFDTFPVLRLPEMPEVEVHTVDSAEAPSGMGEPPVPVTIPAVMNALFAATGKRIRKLPLTPDDLA
ncbi:MAG TPA: molybdopterin cofactor-binding domain-containing protein [Holophagaceae bacterium]